MSWIIKKHLQEIKDNEWGARVCPPGLRHPIAFVYPNEYHLGMSNLGLHIIYQLINLRPDSACERFFLPDKRLREEHRKSKTPLLSIETQRPLADFAVIFVMLSFEMDYDNLLTVLNLGNIRLRSKDRNAHEPLVIIGGPCATFNPEPLAQVADAFVIGEGEETVSKILDVVYSSDSKEERLGRLARLAGVYVPSFYEPCYDGEGAFVSLVPRKGAPARIERQWVSDIDAYPHTSAILTDATEFEDMYIVEVARGCGRHCRFCMAGFCFRRPRNRSFDAILEDVAKRPERAKKIGLMGAAVSDYPYIKELTAYLVEKGLSFSVASLRADTLDIAMAEALAASGQRTMTVAPEAGSVRMRAAINKGITEEHIYNAVTLAAKAGMRNIKLYYMIGLPHEEDEDINEMASMIIRIRRRMDEEGNKGELVVSVNGFIPKPFTPYQWSPLCDLGVLKRRFKILHEAVKRERKIKLITESLKETLVQAVLAKGDRRVGEALLKAHESGKPFKSVLKECGMDPEIMATSQLTVGQALPWQHIDIGVTEAYLAEEFKRSASGRFTPTCFEGCRRCGVCK